MSWIFILFCIALAISTINTIRLHVIIYKRKKEASALLRSMNGNVDIYQHKALYPALGIEIYSNYAIKPALSVYNWTFEFKKPSEGYALMPRFVEIKANGFWSANWLIKIDLRKAELIESYAGKFEIHEYLLSNGIINPNNNLY